MRAQGGVFHVAGEDVASRREVAFTAPKNAVFNKNVAVSEHIGGLNHAEYFDVSPGPDTEARFHVALDLHVADKIDVAYGKIHVVLYHVYGDDGRFPVQHTDVTILRSNQA